MEWDILGHQWAAHQLQEHIARQSVRHAYLFTGPTGVGKRTLALRFAQALNCTQPPQAGIPCRKCRTCLQIINMRQSDLSIVRAELGGTIKVDAIRELTHRLSLSTYESRYRVALLLNFEDANANAQNALLKTLEEAPTQAILMVTAGAAEQLLPTIVSRCEVLRLRPMPVQDLAATLVSNYQVEADQARLLAHLASGRVGAALSLHSDLGLLSQRASAIEKLTDLLKSPLRERFNYAEKITNTKNKTPEEVEDIRRKLRLTLEYWLTWWRDILLAASGSRAPLVNIDREEEIHSLAARMELQAGKRFTSALQQTLYQLDANINARLAVEVLLMDWPRLA